MRSPEGISILHTLLAWVFGTLSMIILGLLAILGGLINPSGDLGHLCGRLWGRLVVWLSGVKVEIQGLEHVDRYNPQILMANHQGSFDIWVLMGYLPIQFRWLVKKELFDIPILGRAMRRAGYVAVDRQDQRRARHDLREALKRLEGGRSLLIFPEGTRTRTGQVGEFKRGGFLLATLSGRPIVPICIQGSFQIMPKGRFWIAPRKVKVTILPPIPTSGLDRQAQRELPAKIRRLIISHLATPSD